MKKSIILLTILTIFASCRNGKDNFEKYEWVLYHSTYKGNNNVKENTRTLFRNDSVVSFSRLQNKEITFPLIKLDSTIIIKQLLTISDYKDENKRDTLTIDTLLYDFKNIFDRPVLILKAPDTKRFTILTCKNCENDINTTSNFFTDITVFKIGGLTIGDTISKEKLISIKDCDGYDEKGLIEANLVNNKNVKVKLINRNIVYSIKQEMIEEESIKNIIDVINSKTDVSIDTIKKYGPFYTEGFWWFTGELDIRLSKDDLSQYYLDRAEQQTKKDLKYYFLKISLENRDKNKYWELKYDNILLQTILRSNQAEKKISTIIE